MKNHSLGVFAVALVCVLTAGCTSVPKDQIRVSSTAVFSRDDERVWLLKIETQRREKFRLVGRQFELWGETAGAKAGSRKRCIASVWLVGSQIIYGEHNYIKMVAQGCGSTVTSTQEVGKNDKLSSVVDGTLPDGIVIHQLNCPLVIGKTGSQDMRLTVGPAVYERNAEPSSAANVSQPIRSETNPTSSATGSRR